MITGMVEPDALRRRSNSNPLMPRIRTSAMRQSKAFGA